MKHGSFKFICLIIWACIMVSPGFSADDIATNLESRILESFNGDSEYTWKAESSKFITKTDDVTYPVLNYVDAWPVAVFGYNRPDDSPPLKSLGIHGRFDRVGYNWIDIYPVLADGDDEEPYEIAIPGKVRNFDMWIWGANLRYYIEIYVRDYRGVVHALKLGDISYNGWRNLQVSLPSHIVQTKRTLPSYAGLRFVKFRIWTQPVERVDDFYIYFKQFKVLTDMFAPLFDGNDLADPDHVQKLWANNQGVSER
ncbi:MAG: flagellar filament outer layer protein FlaA [Treponema sp.]|jgi:hypothetical protein|nr:flagellar filament outer layer protein FlaA [Treponema sp.]